jgi:polyhydroxyalkanoate synthesis regulator phasin
MAKSKAQKLRAKLVREGRMNPEEKRSPFVFTDMRTRTTKTKKDRIYQYKQKNHQSQDGYDGSFYFEIYFPTFANTNLSPTLSR